MPDRSFQKHLPLLLLVLYLLSPALTLRLNPNSYIGGRSRNEADRGLRNQSAAAWILGELRSSLSDILFIKTELYLHSGVAYKIKPDYDALARPGMDMASHDAGTTSPLDLGGENQAALPGETQEYLAHDHETGAGEEVLHLHCKGADTMIPTRNRDFRGFIGDLQREVKPWQDPSKPHLHTDGRELLPWYRLMTLSDPHNIRGYMIGAWWLKRFRTEAQLREARKFLNEGIRYNPEGFQLYLMQGHVLRSLGDNEGARKAYREAAERVIRQRPPGGKIGPAWTEYNEEDALASIRLAILTEEEFGNREEALRLALHYREHIGQDHVLDRQIKALMGK